MAKVETLVKFLDYIRKHPEANDREIAEAIGVTQRYVRECKRDVKLLKHHLLDLVLGNEDIRILLSKFNPLSKNWGELHSSSWV